MAAAAADAALCVGDSESQAPRPSAEAHSPPNGRDAGLMDSSWELISVGPLAQGQQLAPALGAALATPLGEREIDAAADALLAMLGGSVWDSASGSTGSPPRAGPSVTITEVPAGAESEGGGFRQDCVAGPAPGPAEAPEPVAAGGHNTAQGLSEEANTSTTAPVATAVLKPGVGMTGERDDQPEGERQEEGSSARSVEAAGLSVDGTVGRAAEGPTEARVSRSGTGCGMGDGDGGGGGGGGSFASGTSGAAAAAEACGALALPLGPGLPLGGLVAAAKEMLRRPGMQQEVLRFLEEDPGARRLLLQLGGGTPLILPAPVPAWARGREGAGTPVSAPGPEETDTELEPAAPHSCTAGTSGPGAAGAAASPAAGSGPTQRSAGIHSSKGSDEGSDGNDRDDAGAGGRDGAGGPNLASRVAGAVVGGLEHAGGKLAGLGGWLRSRLGHAPPAPQPQPHPKPGEREPARQEQGRQASASGGSGGPGGAQAKAPWAPPPPVGGGCGRDAGSGFGSERTPLQHGAEPLVAVVALVVAIFCVAFLRRSF